MDFKPIRPKRLYQDIVEQIRALMDGGELRPGDRLLPERDLAQRLQVSRVSVREAIRALEMMGVVEIRPGEGTFVRDRDSDQVIRPLALFLAVERTSLLEMFEVRRIFETATASLAAERASDEEVADVLAALESMTAKINVRDSEKGEEFDIAFHYAIAEATHNPLLIKLFRTLQEEFGRAVSAARRQLYQGEDNPRRILEQHRKVYRAIKAHDPAKAAQAMLAHLTYAERELRKRLA